MTSLLVVAHPDDESIFFGGLLAETARSQAWHVVCVTDGNGEGRAGERSKEFIKACQMLGVARHEQLNFPDAPGERIDVEKLQEQLERLKEQGFERVYTHGIIGEYGHKHHQDVSFATHQAFSQTSTPVFSNAYNIFPDETIRLSERAFRLKSDVMWSVYKKEVRRFLNILPAHSFEGYARISFNEITAIYRHLAQGDVLEIESLKHYRWMFEYLTNGDLTKGQNMFLGNYFKS